MFRINEELRFLPIKKTPNQQLYHLLKCANTWHNSWSPTQNNLEDKLHSFIHIRYENLQQKTQCSQTEKKKITSKVPQLTQKQNTHINLCKSENIFSTSFKKD